VPSAWRIFSESPSSAFTAFHLRCARSVRTTRI
jgi:hypothetical protein